MEAHSPSFSCCVVPNFFQFIHLVSACLLPSEICLGPLLSFLTEPSSPLRNGFWLAGPRCTGFWEHYMPLWRGRIWCPNCFLNTKWQRSRKSPPACLFCFNILKWSTAHAEKTYRVLHGFMNEVWCGRSLPSSCAADCSPGGGSTHSAFPSSAWGHIHP